MILIIDTSKANGNVIADIMRHMGFLAYATTPLTALGEFSNLYTAIIVSNPERFPDIEDYVRRLRMIDERTMIFSISKGVNPHPEIFNLNFKNNIYSTTLAKKMIAYSEKNRLKAIGIYRTNDLSLSAGFPSPTYKGKPIEFSKTELRILKFLAYTTPTPQKISKIIKYVYSPYKRPEPSGVRSHICHINTKFRELTGQNLIEMKHGEGYHLLILPHAGDYVIKRLSTYF